MDVVIRRATADDVPMMCDISLRAHQHSYANLIPRSHWAEFSVHYGGSPESRRTLERILLRGITSPGRSGLVAECGGGIVGYALGERTAPSQAHKHGLFVDPQFQGKGIGRRLFEASLAGLEDATIDLLVLRGNKRAINLYEAYGFMDMGRADVLFFGAEQIIMKRPQLLKT